MSPQPAHIPRALVDEMLAKGASFLAIAEAAGVSRCALDRKFTEWGLTKPVRPRRRRFTAEELRQRARFYRHERVTSAETDSMQKQKRVDIADKVFGRLLAGQRFEDDPCLKATRGVPPLPRIVGAQYSMTGNAASLCVESRGSREWA